MNNATQPTIIHLNRARFQAMCEECFQQMVDTLLPIPEFQASILETEPVFKAYQPDCRDVSRFADGLLADMMDPMAAFTIEG